MLIQKGNIENPSQKTILLSDNMFDYIVHIYYYHYYYYCATLRLWYEGGIQCIETPFISQDMSVILTMHGEKLNVFLNLTLYVACELTSSHFTPFSPRHFPPPIPSLSPHK